MQLQKISVNFNRKVNGIMIRKGMAIVKKNNILSLEVDSDGLEMGMMFLRSEVRSDESLDIYSCHVEIDEEEQSILRTECECRDHYNHSFYNESYCCKHITATMITFIEKLRNGEILNDKIEASGDRLLTLIDKSNFKSTSAYIEVNLTKIPSYSREDFRGEFKIGGKKLYIIKNIEDLINARRCGNELVYGKEFTYKEGECSLSEEDNKLLDYFEDALVTSNTIISGFSKSKLIQGKYLTIPQTSLKRFLSLFEKKRIIYNGIEMEIIKEDLPIEFEISNNDKGDYTLSLKGMAPVKLIRSGEVYIYNNNFYIPSRTQVRNLNLILDNLTEGGYTEFKKDKGTDVFNKLLPNLEKISSKVEINKCISDVVKNDLVTRFYIDMKNRDITIDVRLNYGDEELTFFNSSSEKIIIRDGKKEEAILNALEFLTIIKRDNTFIFNGNEERIYDFLREDYKALESLGEVYYSDKFKERRIYSTPKVSGEIKKSKGDYLEFTFNIEEVNPKEYKNILKAFKDKRRYYRLDDNSFINLESKETKELFEAIVELSEGQKDVSSFALHKSKSFLLNEFLD
ncbi:MAG: SNF2 helicase associated domain-containing protein, partial [Clostridium sp.]